MTESEALEIIAKAKPIVLPTSGTTDIKKVKIITSFKDIIYGKGSKNSKEKSKVD